MNPPRPQPPQRSAEAPPSSSSPGEAVPPGSLAALATRARAASPDSRGPLLAALVAQLRAPQASPAAHAEALVALLDGTALEGLDDGGVPLRVTAVRALLSLGYPHALQVAPEDLELLRLHDAPAPRALFRVPAGVATVGAITWLATTAHEGSGPLGWLTDRDVPVALAVVVVPCVALVGFGGLLSAASDALGQTQQAARGVLGLAAAALTLLGAAALLPMATAAGAVLAGLGAVGVLAALLPRQGRP